MPTVFGQEPAPPVRRSAPPPKSSGGGGQFVLLLILAAIIAYLVYTRPNTNTVQTPEPTQASVIVAAPPVESGNTIVDRVPPRPTQIPTRVQPTNVPPPVTTEEAVVESTTLYGSGIYTSSFNVIQDIRYEPDMQVNPFASIPVNTWVQIACEWPDPGGWYSWYYLLDDNYEGWVLNRFWYEYTYADGSPASGNNIPECIFEQGRG